jgi:hypothetical protein
MENKQFTKEELKEKRKQEAAKKRFEIGYEAALKEKSLPEFRIKDEVILIKRMSDKKLQQYKKIWLKELKSQVESITLEQLCEYWNDPFCVGIREYNPHDLIVQYFYHKQMVDISKFQYKLVDNF